MLLFVVIDSKAQDIDTYYIYKNNDSIKQVDGIDYLLKLFKIKKSQEKIENKKVNFSFFPVDASNAGDRVLVSSFNATFLLGEKENTNNSTVYLIPFRCNFVERQIPAFQNRQFYRMIRRVLVQNVPNNLHYFPLVPIQYLVNHLQSAGLVASYLKYSSIRKYTEISCSYIFIIFLKVNYFINYNKNNIDNKKKAATKFMELEH